MVDGRLHRSSDPGARIETIDQGRTRRLVAHFASGLVVELAVGEGAQGAKVLVCSALLAGNAQARCQALYPLLAESASGLLPARLTSAAIDGYQSWDYAGLLAGQGTLTPSPELAGVSGFTGRSWWGGCLATEAGALCVQALSGRRAASVVAWRSADSGVVTALALMAGGSPMSLPEGRSGDPEPLDLALDQAVVKSDPVALLWSPGAEEGRLVLAAEAARAAGSPETDGPAPSGWLSWYHHGISVTPSVVRAQAKRLRDLGRRELYAHIQIDDGWQVCYGDWQPGGPFGDTGAITGLVRELAGMGYRAGLWWAPFLVSPASRLAKGTEFDEWFLHEAGGRRLVDPRQPEQGNFILDASHPAVMDHLLETLHHFLDWGFSYIKSDFLYAGGYEAVRHRRVTGQSVLHDCLRRFREARGPGGLRPYLLACGAPWGAAIGTSDAWRSGGDIGGPLLQQDGTPGPPAVGMPGVISQVRNLVARAHLHRQGLVLDPDAVMITGGSEGPQFTVEQAAMVVDAWAMAGGPFFLSDDLLELPAAKLHLLTSGAVAGAARGGFRPLDPERSVEEHVFDHFFTQPHHLPALWVARRPEGVLLAHFGWSGAREVVSLPVAAIEPEGVRPGWFARRLKPTGAWFEVGERIDMEPGSGSTLLQLRAVMED